MKHIKMPKKIAVQWLKDLRSGKFKQGRGCLVAPKTSNRPEAEYCCLGVLCERLRGRKLMRTVSEDGENELPSRELLEKHNIKFHPGPAVWNNCPESGLSPWLDEQEAFASDLNDSGTSFAEIADLLEKEIQYV